MVPTRRLMSSRTRFIGEVPECPSAEHQQAMVSSDAAWYGKNKDRQESYDKGGEFSSKLQDRVHLYEHV